MSEAEPPKSELPKPEAESNHDSTYPSVSGDSHAKPVSLDLDREKALTIVWQDGAVSTLPVPYLRRMSPSADSRVLRDQIARNPLTVLPSAAKVSRAKSVPLRAESAELVGHYALKITFSDGHATGLFSWKYLRSIDRQQRAK